MAVDHLSSLLMQHQTIVLPASWQGSWVLGGTPGAPSSTEPEFTVVSIYNIQYTTDANGASPLVGDQVQTTGIVTGCRSIRK